MKMIFIIILSLITVLDSGSRLEYELDLMSPSQKNILRTAYKLGKEFDFGYTMAAIAWVESNAGKWLINIQDPSFGVFHNNINTVMKRLNIQDTPFNRNVIAQRLIDSVEFAATQTLIELEYWKTVHGPNRWTKIWGSYNGGWNINTQYATQIKYRIRILQKFLNK